MRTLITGVDAAGRSCVTASVAVVPAPPAEDGHGVLVARAFATDGSPPPPRAPSAGNFVEMSLEPGVLRWLVVDHPAHDPDGPRSTSTTLHHGDVLDLVFVHEGGGELILEDGAHPVSAGDLIVMPGVEHAMRSGPDGCRLVVVSIGTPPPVSPAHG